MKKVYYSDQNDLEGLRWTARVIDFGVGLMVSSAINEMLNTYALLVVRNDILKREVKNFCNRAFAEAKRKERLIKESMVNKQFWLDYSDKVIDEAENDITLFRISIKQTLDDAKVKDSELLSHIETARVMLEMATEQFKLIMERAREKYARDYTDVFLNHRMDSVLYWWGKMSDIISKDAKADLNNANTKAMFDRMCRKFAEGEYIQACLEEARRNNPDFDKNEVKVKSEE